MPRTVALEIRRARLRILGSRIVWYGRRRRCWQSARGHSSEAPAAPWLPQPEAFGELAADVQAGVGGSTLELYRSVLAFRRAHRLGSGTFQWAEEHDPANGVLAFHNRDVLVVVNMGTAALPVPAGFRVELSSDGGSGGTSIVPNSGAYLVAK